VSGYIRLTDGTTQLAWDVHDRLRSVTVSGGTSATYTYDAFGRRITKSVTQGGTTVDTVFLYDVWNLNLEETKNQAPGTTNVIKRHTWGADLSGTLQGAGGGGGLLLTETVTPGNLPVPMYAKYDGNGNLTALAGAGGVAVAAAENPFRFSSKVGDEESGLVYYGPPRGALLYWPVGVRPHASRPQS